MNAIQLIEKIEKNPEDWKFYRTRGGNIAVYKDGTGHAILQGDTTVTSVDRVTASTNLKHISLTRFKNEI